MNLERLLAGASRRSISPTALTLGEVLLLGPQPGDFDYDGDVDGAEFLIWQRDPSIGSLADWEANYGTVAPLSESRAVVPEPTAMLLACAAALMLPRRLRG